MERLALAPADRHEHARLANVRRDPRDRVDRAVRGFDLHSLAVGNAGPRSSRGMNLDIQVRPHFLRLPRVMRPAVEVRCRWPAGDQLELEALLAQPRSGRLGAGLADAHRRYADASLVERR